MGGGGVVRRGRWGPTWHTLEESTYAGRILYSHCRFQSTVHVLRWGLFIMSVSFLVTWSGVSLFQYCTICDIAGYSTST